MLFFEHNTYAEGVTPEKQITVVFRFDDYSSLSPTEFDVKGLATSSGLNAFP